MAKKSERKTRSKKFLSSSGKYISKLDADGSRSLVRKKLDQGNWKRQFRGSLSKTVRFFEDITRRPVHFECLKRTPFYHFVLSFAKGKFSAGFVRGMLKGMIPLLMTYKESKNAFVISGKKLVMEPQEFDFIFGIPSGQQPVCFTRSNAGNPSLIKRKFAKFSPLRTTDLKHVLMKYLKSNDEQDVSDTIRIVIVHLLSTVFFVAGGDVVSMWMFNICEDIDSIQQYNWGMGVIDYFIKYLKRKSAEKVRGCTIFFMYWICERIKLIKPRFSDAFPRFRKWKLGDVNIAFAKKAVKDIPHSTIRDKPIKLSHTERSILFGERTSTYILDSSSEEDEETDDDNNTDTYDILSTKHTTSDEYFTEGPILQIEGCNIEQQLASVQSKAEMWEAKAKNWESLQNQLEEHFDKMHNILSNSQIERSSASRLTAKLTEVKQKLAEEVETNKVLRDNVKRLEIDNELLKENDDKLLAQIQELKEKKSTDTNSEAVLDANVTSKALIVVLEKRMMEPTFKLLSQSPTPTKSSDTFITEIGVQNCELRAQLAVLEMREVQHLRKIEDQELKIKNLSEALDKRPVKVLTCESSKSEDDAFQEDPSRITGVKRKITTHAVSKSTRSKKKITTLNTSNSMLKIKKGLSRFIVYQNLSFEDRAIVDGMAL